MDLYIQIRNGQPHEHPILGDNLRAAFPHLDPKNLPSGFAAFIRVPCSVVPGTFEIPVARYAFSGEIVRDVWSLRPMTPAERADKVQQLTRAAIEEQVARLADARLQLANSNPAGAPIWSAYIAALEAWSLVDVERPAIPRPPRQLADGTWISPQAPGSAPDVIG